MGQIYMFIYTGNDASDIVNLGRLKGNIGNQNYEIPIGIDLAKYNTVLVWCKAFSTLFGNQNLIYCLVNFQTDVFSWL